MSRAESDLPVIAEAARQVRAPWAASVAGLLFAALFTAGMVLIRSQPFIGAAQASWIDYLRRVGISPGWLRVSI